MIITAKLLRSWDACYTDERIAEVLARYKRATPAAIAADTSLPVDDRLWCLIKALWHLDESAARLFAVECAETVAHLAGDEDDIAQFHGLLNDMRQIEIELPPEQRDAAWAAAWDTAWAAWDAAWAVWAVWDASWDAAIEQSITRILEWMGEDVLS